MSGAIVHLGLDQGTSRTRCPRARSRSADRRAQARCRSPRRFRVRGLVEQDPGELTASALAAIEGALREAGARVSDVVALGIANQTETFVVCERESGGAIHPAIVWQDRRTADRCAALAAAGHGDLIRERTGLELDPTFPATKLGWLLDDVDGARARAQSGELVYHDVAGWLIRSLTGLEVCDAGNAGRTLLCGLGGSDWDEQLLGPVRRTAPDVSRRSSTPTGSGVRSRRARRSQGCPSRRRSAISRPRCSGSAAREAGECEGHARHRGVHPCPGRVARRKYHR